MDVYVGGWNQHSLHVKRSARTAAVKATEDPNEGRPKQKLNVTASQTGSQRFI